MAAVSWRTRSTMRASRVEVEKIRVPQAEMRTAGVIIPVSTPRGISPMAPQLTRFGRDLARSATGAIPVGLDSFVHMHGGTGAHRRMGFVVLVVVALGACHRHSGSPTAAEPATPPPT